MYISIGRYITNWTESDLYYYILCKYSSLINSVTKAHLCALCILPSRIDIELNLFYQLYLKKGLPPIGRYTLFS